MDKNTLNSKTLYISDLDGTLLTPSATVSEFTKNAIDTFVKKRGCFSIATARTHYSVKHILHDVNISIPAALMNGAVLYDLKADEFVDYSVIPAAAYKQILALLKKFSVSGFLYEVDNNQLRVYYENLDTDFRKQFHDERVRLYNKPYIHTPDFSEADIHNPVYFSLICTHDELEPVTPYLKEIPGIDFAFYKDNYLKDGWFLEIYSSEASKYNAVMKLRKRYGFKSVTGFGDNLNDLPLRKACDTFYAVENAADELKAQADAIIESNRNDGVAKKLLEI